jgi:hypothetical protein
MASTNDVLQEARDLISTRLTDLDEERQRLERALIELSGTTPRRKPGRPRGSKASPAAKASTENNGRRSRGGSPGGSQVIKLLRLAKINPDATNAEIAAHLGQKESTATAFVSKVKAEGLIYRENKKLVVTEAGQALLNDQPKPSAAKPPTAKKDTASKAKKAPVKKQAKAKKASSKKAAKSSSAKPAKAKASSSSAAKKAPAAPGSTAGAGAGDKASEKTEASATSGSDGNKGKEGGSNLLYDK